MITVLMVAAPEQFRDEELTVPREVFLKQGWNVVVASTRKGVGTGMLGHQESFHLTLEDIADARQYQALVIVGGFGAVQHLWHNAHLHDLCHAVARNEGVVAAICVSPVVLANAGLLTNRQATVYEMPESLECFTEHAVEYTGQPVTVDGRLVTANDPEAAATFAQAVVGAVMAEVLTH